MLTPNYRFRRNKNMLSNQHYRAVVKLLTEIFLISGDLVLSRNNRFFTEHVNDFYGDAGIRTW